MKLLSDFNPFLLPAVGAIVGFVMIVIVDFFVLDLLLMISGVAAPPLWLS